jgi:HD superfamily phosphohydrolase
LAGLLHDIGHAAFSHMWETFLSECGQTWTHEDEGIRIIDYMLTSNNIQLDADENNHNQMRDLIFALINADSTTWNSLLRPSERFLTEIVSNKHCHLDVDKVDYLLRDSHYTKQKIRPFFEFINRARVVYDSNGISHIGYPSSFFPLIENIFINRAYFHKFVYQDTRVVGVERQVKDICKLADEANFKISGYRLSHVHRNCKVYTSLDDSIIEQIQLSSIMHDKMDEAKELIRKLKNNEYYELVSEEIRISFVKIYQNNYCIIVQVYESSRDKEIEYVLERLGAKFGKDKFCKVKKFIPNAQVPHNIPFYDEAGDIVFKFSQHELAYSSILIYSKTFDPIINAEICDFLSNNNF